ncbi:MAG: hypothetical protein Kow0063_38710 [Anaerolineae bacterium]
MKIGDGYETPRPGQASSGDQMGQPGAQPGPGYETLDIQLRHTAQAERGVMHPERDDIEWRYWRGGWGRLTE